MMVARIRRENESGRTISGRGQVRAPAVLEIITKMKKLTRKVEGILGVGLCLFILQTNISKS